MKPLFTYMGSKHGFISAYEDLDFFLQEDKFDFFVDLFAGGLSMSLEVAKRYPKKKIIINDLNPELVSLYLHIREDFELFIKHFEKVKIKFILAEPSARKPLYYEYREKYLNYRGKINNVEMSATLLMLLQYCFSGVWRSSKKHGDRFSTASSDFWRSQPKLEAHRVYAFHKFLTRCEIVHGHYQDLKIPGKAWIFADPPYRGRTDMNLYNSGGFDDDSQRQLASFLTDTSLPVAFANLELGDGFWEDAFGNGFKTSVIPTRYKAGLNQKGPLVAEALVKNY